tara:strand:- start:616 stop:4173 length:3558 start_codon:yes stop_codon:yes gene_type:complete
MTDINYYTNENMQNKKMSDLTLDRSFLNDAFTFLKSDRMNYKDEDFKGWSASDVTDKVLEHMRYQSMNERTMYKDYYFIADDKTPKEEKEAFTRLMFAFDNAKGEGMFDRGAEAIQDYAGAILSSPTTMAAGAVGLFTGGIGGVAVKAGTEALKAGAKSVTAATIRKAGSGILKRSLITAAADGSIAAGADLANQRIRQIGGKEIGVERDVSLSQAAVSGGLGAITGGVFSAVPAAAKRRASRKIAQATLEGGMAQAKKAEDAVRLAKVLNTKFKTGTKEQKQIHKYINATLLRSIDPTLVKAGNVVKKDIFSDDLPDGLVGGFNKDTLQRLSAAAIEISRDMGVKVGDDGVPQARITEVLADSIRKGDGKAATVVDEIREKYGLSREQISAVYAAEISEAGSILRLAANNKDALGRSVKGNKAKKYADLVESLYEQGMSPLNAAELAATDLAEKGGLKSFVVKNLKDIENMRRMFMTSQPATTMRNNIFSAAMTGIDFFDQMNLSIVRFIRKDPEASAGATLRGSLDNFRMLTTDSYVAEALVSMLNDTAPKRMSKVFFDAAISESVLVKNNKFSKLGAATNVLNTMSDRVVKRGIIAGSINRQLRERGDDLLGNSVLDMMSKGKTAELPDDILQEAIDEAMAFTFQRNFGGKGASDANKAAGALIRTIHNYGLTLAIPFPRYLASQAKFVSDYTGLTVLRRMGSGKRVDDQEWAKGVTGAMGTSVLLGGYMKKVHDGTEWNEVTDPSSDRPYDGQSAMGPLTSHAYVVDYMARRIEGMPTKDTAVVLKDLGKILGTSEFRPDTGIVNDFIRFAEGTDTKGFMRSLADIAAPMTYPAAVLKDFYGQFDPQSSHLANVEDASNVNAMDLYGLNIPMSLLQRATKQLPDFNTDVMANTFNEMFGTDINPDGIISYLEFASTATRTFYQSEGDDYTPNAGASDLGYDAISMDITADGPRRIINPLDKQLFGLVGRPVKNKLQREITRLQIDAFRNIYNPYQEKNRTLEVYFQQFAQGRFADTMANFIDSSEYKAYDDDRKKLALIEMSSAVKSIYREAVMDHLEKFATARPEIRADYESFVRSEYQSMTKRERVYADINWQNSKASYVPIFGADKEDMSLDQALEWLETAPAKSLTEEDLSKEKIEDIRRVMTMKLLIKYTEDASILRRAFKSGLSDNARRFMNLDQ